MSKDEPVDLLMDFLMEVQKINPEANSNLHYTIFYLKGDAALVKRDWELNQKDPHQGFKEYNYANNYLFEDDELVELYLGSMNLNSIPDSVKSFAALRKLNFSHNSISHLPEGIHEMEKLTKLHLNNNKFREFPNSLFEIKSLEELHIQNNDLIVVPDELAEYKSLKFLNILDNPLNSLPKKLLDNFDIVLRSPFRDDLEDE